MLPDKLAKLRIQIEADRFATSDQKALLKELVALDSFLESVPKAQTAAEVKSKMLTEGLEKRAYASVTSGPGGVCDCCGRKL